MFARTRAGRVGLVARCLFALCIMPRQTLAFEVRLDCPQLSAEQLASLEARVRAELILSSSSNGDIQIICAPPLAVVTYWATPSLPQSDSVHLPAQTDRWVEEILPLVHKGFANVQPAASPQNATPPPVAQSTAQAGTLFEPTIRTVFAEEVIPREFHPQPRQTARAVVGAGLCTQYWTRPENAFLGPCVSGGIRLSPALRVAATVAAQFGLARPADIGVQVWSIALSSRFGQHWWVEMAPALAILRLSPPGGLLPASRYAYEPAMDLRAGRTWSSEGQHLSLSVGLRVYAANREVRVDGTPAFSLPMVTPTLDMQYDLDL